MENLKTAYEFKVEYSFQVWTDDFILPKTIKLKSTNCPSPLFIIEIRVQEFLQYLPKGGDSIVQEPRGPHTVKSFYLPSNVLIHDDIADDSIGEILSSVDVPSMLPIIRGVSSFARTMMSLPANFGRPLLPIVLGIAVTSWDPRDVAIEHERKFDLRQDIEEGEKEIQGLSCSVFRFKV